MALGIGFSSSLLAQGRTIEETLVVKDPTVATKGNWIAGGALELWYVFGKFTQYDANNNKIADGDLKFTQPGANLFAGYGDFTFLVTGRSGKGDEHLTYAPGALGVPQSVATTTKVKQTDSEYILRYLVRPLSSRVVTPYVLAGYTETKLNQDETLDTPGLIWTVNNTTTRHFKYDYKGPLVGLGGIFPFSEKFGARVDGRVKFYKATLERDTSKIDGTGTGYDFVATGYYNITQGLNLQAGYKYTKLAGGDVGWLQRNGIFAMLGYTHRF
jgi:hypothetical protein